MHAPGPSTAIPRGENTPLRIGVVIPVRNRPGLVLEALESVRAQTLPPDRLVVVDDGSTDPTPERIDQWIRTNGRPGWELVRAAHHGAAVARQHGFSRMPEVDLVAFLDSDDLWPPDLVRRAAALFDESSDLIGASADRRTTDASSGRDQFLALAPITHHPLRWLVIHDAGIGSCTFIRADALRSAGGYPTGEPTGHDIELFARLMTLGPWGHLPGEPVTFRRHHAKQRGEADHIYQQVQDANLRHARLYERVVAAMSPADARSWQVRRSMGRRWISAAKDAYRIGDTTGIHQCLCQSRRHLPISLRAARLKWKARRLVNHPDTRRPS